MTVDFSNLNISSLYPETPFDEQVVNFIRHFFSGTETVEVQTSGSTGTPKKLQVTKERMKISARKTCSFLNLAKNDKALLCLPVEYISGMMMIVRAAESGMQLSTAMPNANPLENLTEHFDFCALTPLQTENSLDKIHLIRKIIIGGAAVAESLKKKIRENLNQHEGDTAVYETFGMTETLSHIALKQIYPTEESFFEIFPGVQIEQDSRGCLRILVPELHEGWLKTNDVVELVSPSRFRFLGRADHVINSGGAKIHPEEIEQQLRKVISRELVVLGIKDESLGEKPVLLVEGLEDAAIPELIAEINFAKKFHRPAAVYFVSKIPRTANGKISRNEAKKLLNL